MENDERKPALYPIRAWGRDFWSCWTLYRAAPRKPAVAYGGFKSRVRRFHKLNGYIDTAAVEQCLYEPPHAFDGGGVVYEIVQRSTGRKYIGITDDPEARWEQHKKAAAEPKARLHQEMQKAGVDDFAFEVVVKGKFPRHVLARLEVALISGEGTVWPEGLNMLRRGR